ncbi:hypothetical protein K7432_004657 [Basidiobolus ranarum]|uniref:HMG box domain-containing protein n=1 Tax=Basidiobolus ranarum TaxID=34480 RepID=A0ABR2WXU1_9FUNG
MAMKYKKDRRSVPFQISNLPTHQLTPTEAGSYYLVPQGYRVLLVQKETLTQPRSRTNKPVKAYLPASKKVIPMPAIATNQKKHTLDIDSSEFGQNTSLWQNAYSNYISLKMEELSKCNIHGESASRLITVLWQKMTAEERLRFQY